MYKVVTFAIHYDHFDACVNLSIKLILTWFTSYCRALLSAHKLFYEMCVSSVIVIILQLFSRFFRIAAVNWIATRNVFDGLAKPTPWNVWVNKTFHQTH